MIWGVLGVAAIAKNEMIPALLSIEGNEVVLASRSQDKAAEAAKSFPGSTYVGSYEELLADESIECVYVPLPIALHYEWVLEALKAGKHVLVEKSTATNLQEVENLVELARKKNLKLVENFQFQHHAQQEKILEMLGDIGEIRCFRSSFGFPPLPDGFRYRKELGGGALLDAGAYVVRAVPFYLSEALQPIAASAYFQDAYEVDIAGSIFMSNESGVSAQLAYGFDNFYQCSIDAWGSKGRLVSERVFTAKKDYEPSVRVWLGSSDMLHKLPIDNPFVSMVRYFEGMASDQFSVEYENILHQAQQLMTVRRISNQPLF